jgi:hypothetical protein
MSGQEMWAITWEDTRNGSWTPKNAQYRTMRRKALTEVEQCQWICVFCQTSYANVPSDHGRAIQSEKWTVHAAALDRRERCLSERKCGGAWFMSTIKWSYLLLRLETAWFHELALLRETPSARLMHNSWNALGFLTMYQCENPTNQRSHSDAQQWESCFLTAEDRLMTEL